jgi:hypothetical protein
MFSGTTGPSSMHSSDYAARVWPMTTRSFVKPWAALIVLPIMLGLGGYGCGYRTAIGTRGKAPGTGGSSRPGGGDDQADAAASGRVGGSTNLRGDAGWGAGGAGGAWSDDVSSAGGDGVSSAGSRSVAGSVGGIAAGGSSRTGGSAEGGSASTPSNGGRSLASVSRSGSSAAIGGTGAAGAAGGGRGGNTVNIGGKTGGAVAGTDGTAQGGADSGTARMPLWRSSTDRFCQKSESSWGASIRVWSDTRGVFLLVRDEAAGTRSVRSNTGNGWRTSYTMPFDFTASSGPMGLRGFVNGPLVAFGLSPCKIQFVDGNSAVCSGAPSSVTDVAVVSASLGYAVYSDRVLRFDGSTWTQFGAVLPSDPSAPSRPHALGVWGNTSIVAVVADQGNVYLVDSAGVASLQSGLSDSDYTAVWGNTDKDIWVGNNNGKIFHYDGARWSLAASLSDDHSSVNKLWGIDGKLFLVADRVFAEWDGTSLMIRDTLPGEARYQDLWGNASDEVFMTMIDYSNTDCGTFQVRWFNGSDVSPL